MISVHFSGCLDTDNRCPLWARVGECVRNPTWMGKYCKTSCGGCGNLNGKKRSGIANKMSAKYNPKMDPEFHLEDDEMEED